MPAALQIAPSATALTPTGSSSSPAACRSASTSGWAGSIAYEPQLELDRAAGLAGDLAEQRAVLLLDGGERRPRRPAPRANQPAGGRMPVVEVAAVDLAEEVRLGADPRVLDRGELVSPPADRLDHPGCGMERMRRPRRYLQLVGRHPRPRDRDLGRRLAHVRDHDGARRRQLAHDRVVGPEALRQETGEVF